MPKSLYIDPDKMRAEGKITFKDIPINTYKKTIKEEMDEGNFTKEDLLRIFRDGSAPHFFRAAACLHCACTGSVHGRNPKPM